MKDKMAGMTSSLKGGQDGSVRSEKKQVGERKMVGEAHPAKKAHGAGQKGHYRSHGRQETERKQLKGVVAQKAGSAAQDGEIPDASQGMGEEKGWQKVGDPIRSVSDLRKAAKNKIESLDNMDENEEQGENEMETEEDGETKEGLTPSGKKRAKVAPARVRNAMTMKE